MPKKRDPELAAALRAADLLTWDELKVLHAARMYSRMVGVSMYELSFKVGAMGSAELEARRMAERAGLSWPTGIQPYLSDGSAIQAVRERWGDLLVAVVEADASQPGWNGVKLLASPTVRDMLSQVHDGARLGRPEFEEILRRVAAALAPPRPSGKRPTTTLEEERHRLRVAELFDAFTVLTEWLAKDQIVSAQGRRMDLVHPPVAEWLAKNRRRGLKGDALLRFLESSEREDLDSANGRETLEGFWAWPRYLWVLIETGGLNGIPGLGGPRIPPRHWCYLEREMLPYVVRAVDAPGKLASARKREFHAFAVAYRLAPTNSTPTAFIHAVREHRKAVRNRYDRRTSGRQRPQLMRPDRMAPILSSTGAENANGAGRKRDTHDAQGSEPSPRPTPPETSREAVQLPARRPASPQRVQREPVANPHRPSGGPRRQARKNDPRPSG